MAFYRCDRGLGFDVSNSTGTESDDHTNTYVYFIDYDGSNAESYEKQYSNFDRSELELALSEIAKECVDKIFGDDSNIGYDEGGDYKEVCYGIVFRDIFIHVN